MAILRPVVALSVVLTSLLVAGHGRAGDSPHASDGTSGSTVIFPYQQRRFLYSRNPRGGLAYVSPGAVRGESLPVVVFLHGMNADELIHPWFGPPYGDLRHVIESLVTSGKVLPLVVAAPTHTRFATGATAMWPRFDLDDFLTATEVALGELAKLDRSRVIVVGHSGAGCNVTGGIFAESVRRAKPLAVVDVDGCLNQTLIGALTEISTSTNVHFFWQRTWPRPTLELESTCRGCTVEEITDLAPGAPHAVVLPEALRRVMPILLPREVR